MRASLRLLSVLSGTAETFELYPQTLQRLLGIRQTEHRSGAEEAHV